MTGRFKSLTGRDLIGASRKFLPMVHFVNYAKMVFAANEIPRTWDNTTAFWNRMIILEFPYTFLEPKEINKLDEKDRKDVKVANTEIVKSLTTPDELSGLLNWSLQGLDRLFTQKGFSYSKSTKEVQDMWIRKSDSFAGFIMDFIVEDQNSTISKGDLRLAYSAYCKKYKVKVMSDKVIKKNMEDMGAEEVRSSDMLRRREWAGVGFGHGVQGVQGVLTLIGISNYSKSRDTVGRSDKVDSDLTKYDESEDIKDGHVN